jgi:hypothetical protein
MAAPVRNQPDSGVAGGGSACETLAVLPKLLHITHYDDGEPMLPPRESVISVEARQVLRQLLLMCTQRTGETL